MFLNLNLRLSISAGIVCLFLLNAFGSQPLYALELSLPAPGSRVNLSPAFNPPILKGIKVHPDDPFRFDFILDNSDALSGHRNANNVTKLIKYFLTGLTIPERDLWVNLSPYEKNRIVPDAFGQTQMGRDLLAEDYILKQISASLTYPESQLGKQFWSAVYKQAKQLGTDTNYSVNTFNKVWIVPDKAVVYENAKAGTAYVVQSTLKVMLEEDYLALKRNSRSASSPNGVASQIIRQIIIPQLTKEVNEGKNFAQLRQVYNSLILATWYKKKIKDSILESVYENKNKTAGLVSLSASETPEAIYQKYLQAFKKGAYNLIKEERDPTIQQIVPRKYFSGGMNLNLNKAMVSELDGKWIPSQKMTKVVVDLAVVSKSGLNTDTERLSNLSPRKLAAPLFLIIDKSKKRRVRFFEGLERILFFNEVPSPLAEYLGSSFGYKYYSHWSQSLKFQGRNFQIFTATLNGQTVYTAKIGEQSIEFTETQAKGVQEGQKEFFNFRNEPIDLISSIIEVFYPSDRAQFSQVSRNIISARVLHPWFVQYNQALRKIINPRSRPFTVAVGFPGADVTNLWLATGFTKAYWIYSTSINQMGRANFQAALDAWHSLNTQDKYFQLKYYAGYSSEEYAEHEPAVRIIEELKAMGASEVHINSKNSSHVELLFLLPASKTWRSIEFIEDKITSPSIQLSNMLRGRLDGYYEKASMYSWHRGDVSRVSQYLEWLKPRGLLIISRYSKAGEIPIKDFNLPQGFGSLAENNADINRIKAQRPHGIGLGHYGWDMDIMANGDLAMNAVDTDLSSHNQEADLIRQLQADFDLNPEDLDLIRHVGVDYLAVLIAGTKYLTHQAHYIGQDELGGPAVERIQLLLDKIFNGLRFSPGLTRKYGHLFAKAFARHYAKHGLHLIEMWKSKMTDDTIAQLEQGKKVVVVGPGIQGLFMIPYAQNKDLYLVDSNLFICDLLREFARLTASPAIILSQNLPWDEWDRHIEGKVDVVTAARVIHELGRSLPDYVEQDANLEQQHGWWEADAARKIFLIQALDLLAPAGKLWITEFSKDPSFIKALKVQVHSIAQGVVRSVSEQRLDGNIHEINIVMGKKDDALENPGGIDVGKVPLTTTFTNNEKIEFHADEAMLKQWQGVLGFTPIVISIKPGISLRRFLGITG